MGSAWYWYASSIRVHTLWDAAHQAGISTASVSWPVSVNATSVDTLIPEYWRTLNSPEGVNPQDRELMVAVSRPDTLLPEMEKRLGPYMMGNETTVDGDRIRTNFSLDILKRKRPGFMTIHLSSLDESEHLFGPFSDEADKTLEAVDEMVGELMRAAIANDPKTTVVVVSDHGFAKLDHALNLSIPFLQSGLIQVSRKESGESSISSWKAQPWSAGGMAAIMLKDPKDTQTRQQVAELLKTLAANPATGISRILSADDVKQAGGFPDAAFVVAMMPGFAIGSALSGPMMTDQVPQKGTHGYLPAFPEMYASFFAMGPEVARGRDLGIIDMREIAPTVAEMLGVNLPSAKQPKLRTQP